MNIKKMMQQAQAMQAKVMEVQEKLADIMVEGTAGGGMVQVTLNCKGEMRGLKIDPKLIDPNDVEMMEDLIIAAFNDAKAKSEERASEEMKSVTGGMGLPGGMDMPF
ncbi:MAG: YbaB/EbfC family nucleoid-associated protein [Alphaproteobacteria bacterium]